MSCVLVNPPEAVFDAIPLAIATIAGALKEDHVPIYLDDMNHRFLDSIFSQKEFLSSSAALNAELEGLLKQDVLPSGSRDRVLQLRETLFKGDIFRQKVEWSKHILKNWHEGYDYNDYRLAEQVRNCATEIFFLKHSDYLDWVGGEKKIKTLSDLCERAETFPRGVASFLEKSVARYGRFWRKHDGPAVLGIAVRSSSQLQWGCALAEFVRRRHPRVKIVLGGSFMSFYMTYYKYQFQRFIPLFEFFDAIVIHDGETAIRELYQKFKDEDNLLDCKNTLSVVGGSVVMQKTIHVENLEDLPTPCFETLDLNQYPVPFPVIPYAPTRGCPFRCAYCNYNLNHYRRYRSEDPASVVSRIVELKKKYNTPYFYWSVSVLPAAYAKKLGDELIRRDADIRWFCQTRPDKGFTREVCNTLYLSGLRYVELGMESASNKVLRKMKKGLFAKDIQNTVDNLSHAGVPLDLFVIVNYPGETLQDFKKTMSFIDSNEMAIISVEFQEFFLSEGTDIWKHPGAYGIDYDPPRDEGDVVFKDSYVHYSGGVTEALRNKKEELLNLFRFKSHYYCLRLDEGKGWTSFKRDGVVYSPWEQFIFCSMNLDFQFSNVPCDVKWQVIDGVKKLLSDPEYPLRGVDVGGGMLISTVTGESMVMEEVEMRLFSLLDRPLSVQDLAIKAEEIYHQKSSALESEIGDVVKYWYKLGFLKAYNIF